MRYQRYAEKGVCIADMRSEKVISELTPDRQQVVATVQRVVCVCVCVHTVTAMRQRKVTLVKSSINFSGIENDK